MSFASVNVVFYIADTATSLPTVPAFGAILLKGLPPPSALRSMVRIIVPLGRNKKTCLVMPIYDDIELLDKKHYIFSQSNSVLAVICDKKCISIIATLQMLPY